MPQTELKVVRCPGCNTAYNALSLPPGKGFRCKKCSTVVAGSAPASDPAPAKRPSSRIDKKTTWSTSRRVKPEGRGEKPERPGSRGSRGGGQPRKTPTTMYVVGCVIGVAILGLVFAWKDEEGKPAPRKVEQPVEPPKVQHPPEDDIDNWELGGHETEFAKQRKRGSSGQDRSKIDPITGQGVTDDPPEPPKEAPPKDPLEDDSQPENRDP